MLSNQSSNSSDNAGGITAATQLLVEQLTGTTISTKQEDNEVKNLYAMFHSAGPTSVLILPALYLSTIALVGIPLNAGIVYTSVRHRKTLNRNANYLIALNAFFDMLQLCHPFPFLFIALSGTNFVGTLQSMQMILPALFGIQASLTCIACTGMDRLLSVLFPLRYHRMSKLERQLYCAMHTLLCVLNGVWNVVGLWQKCAEQAEKPVTGFIGQIGWDSSRDTWHYLVGPILIWLTISCYFAIGLVICIRKKSNGLTESATVANAQQKLLKSLSIIVCVHVGTLLSGSVLLGLASLFTSVISTWYMMSFSLCIILLGACSNAVVLYWNSVEYRLLFNVSLAELKAVGVRAMKVTQAARIFPAAGSQLTNSRSPVQQQQANGSDRMMPNY